MEGDFDAGTLRFLEVGAALIAVFLLLLWRARLVLRLRRGPFYFLAVGSVFESLAFFGILFAEFALGQGTGGACGGADRGGRPVHGGDGVRPPRTLRA